MKNTINQKKLNNRIKSHMIFIANVTELKLKNV